MLSHLDTLFVWLWRGEGEQGRTTWLGRVRREGDWEGEKTWLRFGEGAREGNLA